MSTLEDIKTYAAKLVNVGMVDLGEEAHFGRVHRVLLGKEELEFKDAT